MKTFDKPLTAGEETEILRRLKEGTPSEAEVAKKILIEKNLRLVAHVVRKYQNIDEDQEDLISIGCIGLIKAIDTFDVNRGRLATYACRCIDNEILMMLRNKRKKSKELSLYDPIGQDKEGNEICLLDILEQEQRDIVDDMELQCQKKRLLEGLNTCLDQREREILILRYGLDGSRERTQNQVGEIFGISRSYVSRLEKKALQKLYVYLNEGS